MDYRGNKILRYILEGKRCYISELSNEFKISERVVRRMIRDLNQELKRQKIPEIEVTSDGEMRACEITDDLYEKVRRFIVENDYYSYHLTATERKTIAAMLLLNHDGYLTAAGMSQYLKVSRNTMLNDLGELKEWFSNQHITFVSKVQKGYRTIGEESEIRNGMMKLVILNCEFVEYREGNILDVFHHLLLRELQYEQRMCVISEAVRQEEKKQALFFSDLSFMEVVVELLIIINRISSGNILLEDAVDEDLIFSSKYSFSCAIMERLEEQFQIEIPQAEKRSYVQNLRRKSYIKSSTKNLDEIAIPVMIGETIHRICRRLNVSFYLDFTLYDVLVDHMRSIIYRSRAGEFLPNPFGTEMRERYPEAVTVVRECVEPLERYIGFPFREDEIMFLVMYFAAMMERDVQERMKNQKVTAALVGDLGRGVMNYIQTELEELGDVLSVQNIYSAHEMMEALQEEVDMIITYVSLQGREWTIPIVKIENPVLDRETLYKIRMIATELLEQKSRNVQKVGKVRGRTVLETTENSLLTPDQILLDVKAENWKEAILAAGDLLYQSGAVTSSYGQAMVENVEQNGTYIVIYKGLAIPHAEKEKGAIREAISLVRLEQPVCFGSEENDPVSYVIGMSILKSNSMNQIIYNLIHVFSDSEYCERFDHAGTPEEMYALLKDKI